MSDCLRMPFRYDEARKLKLIQLYRQESCLWNRERHPRMERDDAYNRILTAMMTEVGKDELPLTIENIKTKIKNLRTKYHQELRKMSLKANYEPTSPWFLTLKEFISEYINHKGDISKLENSEDEDILEPPKKRLCVRLTRVKPGKQQPIDSDKAKGTRSDLKVKNEEKPVVADQSLDQDTNYVRAETAQLPVPPVPFAHSSPLVKRQPMPTLLPFSILPSQERQRTVCLPHNSENRSYVRDHANNASLDRERRGNLSLIQGEDEFHYFGLSVAAQLRSMPLAHAMLIQSRFQHILSTERRKITEIPSGDI